MTDERIKQHMDDIALVAKHASVNETLKLFISYINNYWAHRDDESLIKMNYCMVILLTKQGLIDIDEATTDISFIMKQRDLINMMKKAKS